MAQQPDRGINANQEINPKWQWRDTRTNKQKFSDMMADPNNFLGILGALMTIYIIFPQFGEFYTLVGLWLIWFTSKKEFSLPFRIPKTSLLLDPNEPHPVTGKPSPAEGISYFGNEKKTNKELWFNNSDLRTHILIFGSTGAGKALRMDELVHTPNGWKKNKDLKVGEHVSTPTGSSPIVGIFPQGELDLYKINFEDGREIEVSGDHLWEIHHKNWKKTQLDETTFARAKVITTVELLKALGKDKVNKNFYTVLSKEVEKPTIELDLDPYVLGALLGDGCLTHNKRTLKFSNSDIEMIGKLNSLLPTDCEMAQLLTDKKLLGCNSFNKFIPEEYKNSSISQRYQLIQGLMDTDGCAHHGRVEYTTSSKKLAQDVAEVIRSLGGIVKTTSRVTSYTYKGEKKNGQLSYRLHIKHPTPQKLFSLERKLSHVQTYQYKDTLKLRVLSVEKNAN